MAIVSIQHCNNYEYDSVKVAVTQCIDLLGGAQTFFHSGQTVLIKPNLLRKEESKNCVTTHPMVVRVVCEIIAECGASAIIADSPGGVFSKSLLESQYQQTGFADAAAQSGAHLNFNTSARNVAINGEVVANAQFLEAVLDADVVVNLPKLKTHGFTAMSAAVKNLFGCVPGLVKAEYHMLYPAPSTFSNALVDLAEKIKPALNLVDAVWALEGQGPGTSGKPKRVGMLLASADMHSLDQACASVIGLEKVYTLEHAKRRGLDITPQLVGDDLLIPDAYQHALINGGLQLPKFLRKLLERHYRLYPVIKASRCIVCQECVRGCPAKAMQVADKAVHINYKSCISCFCCQELCPEKAIELLRRKQLKKKENPL